MSDEFSYLGCQARERSHLSKKRFCTHACMCSGIIHTKFWLHLSVMHAIKYLTSVLHSCMRSRSVKKILCPSVGSCVQLRSSLKICTRSLLILNSRSTVRHSLDIVLYRRFVVFLCQLEIIPQEFPLACAHVSEWVSSKTHSHAFQNAFERLDWLTTNAEAW